MTVLRLLAAIALYICERPLELYVYWFFNGCHIFNFEEIALRKAKHAGKYVVREESDLGVKITHTTVVEAARCLNLVFSVNKFVL